MFGPHRYFPQELLLKWVAMIRFRYGKLLEESELKGFQCFSGEEISSAAFAQDLSPMTQAIFLALQALSDPGWGMWLQTSKLKHSQHQSSLPVRSRKKVLLMSYLKGIMRLMSTCAHYYARTLGKGSCPSPKRRKIGVWQNWTGWYVR